MPSEVARLSARGQFTLPRHLRDLLGVKPGDYVTLTPTADGVLISPSDPAARRPGEAALIQLVREIGAQLEEQGVTDEEQLDEEIKRSKREAFELTYGRCPS
jgi:AbrB family looped-hinge helix DNA binding protein